MKFNWLCQGNPHDHHTPVPCVPERIPRQKCSEEYDTYADFRSKALDWIINLDVHNTTDVRMYIMYDQKICFYSYYRA